MTIGTARERQPCVSSMAIRPGSVAALALHLSVLSGQRKPGLRMVKSLLVDACGLPIRCRVALCAIASQSALVNILMARGATWRKARPSVIQILIRKRRALRRGDVLQIMAGAAAYAYMFAIEHKTCRGVTESLRSRIPMHHLEVNAVVIGVALDTRCAGRARSRECRMKTFVLLNLVRNFPVTIQTFERGRLHGNLVALDAVRSSIQALMRLCQRSRRDLRRRWNAATQYKTDSEERAKMPIATSEPPTMLASAAIALLPPHPAPFQ